MKKYLFTTIIASILSCSLLMAEDTVTPQPQLPTQQTQPTVMPNNCYKCHGRIKNCHKTQMRAEKAAARFKEQANKATAKGDTQLATLYTNCANAQQKVADAAQAIMNYKKETKADNDMDMNKCKQLNSSLKNAEQEATQANTALKQYKQSNTKLQKPTAPAAATTQSPS